MNKYLLLLFFLLIIGCNKASSNDEVNNQIEVVVLTKEEEIIKLYTETVVPLFDAYKDVNIPPEFQIDEQDLGINAGAAFGYVEVSQGLINTNKIAIQIFVLSHEVSHIVTIPQARMFGLQGNISNGTVTNGYRKAEYLADLIATHLIKIKLPNHYNMLILNFTYLQNLFGVGDFTHPSGKDRIESLKTYLQNCIEKGDDIAFKNSFKKIWEME